ncbi:putative receptor-like protein kinase [Morus notabilis]|uniref:Putative receptor-like protein kinase n=1 Tax=Morus notabilis TaxID=981085 RepID=W9QJB2_9ROSA|nr:probable receptor-like protein kinase At5g61350 [Morus notabilis]EXB38548.1 putative receptor-like protein kinase [Morus notabilis]
MDEFFPRRNILEPHKLSSFSLPLILLIILINFTIPSSSLSSFSPADNYLIDCGSSQQTKLSDGRTFKSERDTASLLSSSDDVQISADSTSISAAKALSSSIPSSSLPLFTTLRVFSEESTYSFHISQAGTHFVRLYFFPVPHATYNFTAATFTVTADNYVLLEDFSVSDYATFVYKEYFVNASDRFSLVFKPKKKSFAFINAIEVVSAPDSLVADSATAVFSSGVFNGLFKNYAFQVFYRLNVGGPNLGPENDTLYRTWESDSAYNAFVQGSKSVSVSPKTVKYRENNGELSLTPLIAPNWVYASAQEMQDPVVMEPNFNLTWRFSVDQGFSYLIRMHFCDIVSLALNSLYFNVYINEMIAVSSLDLSSLTGALATAYYRDFVLDSANVTNSSIMVQVGCANLQSGVRNAILNGLEIIKISNSAGSLNGTFTVDGKYKGPGSSALSPMKIVAAVGLGLAVTVMFLLGAVCVRWQRRPQGWEKRKSFSSWLLPLQAGYSSANYWSSRSSSRRSSLFGSRRSKSGYSGYFASSVYFGRVFTLGELQAATQNFDEKAVIGVGGFGKVYLGVLEDGTKLAIKRGNPSSEQGINEFKTEIEMLSKLRHRHLVSLIGFCDEQSEMILVYEYMANGPLRDHLYGSNLPPLSWKQRLEICIGAARGLHYLHTGAAQGIIHRDVKTTNILLDDNFVAKVADFGLSKAAPSLDKTHVSTAVKGSFGYLDPEYFRRQQLTEKSDVYSFGVVLFEALCARTVIDPKLPREQVSLAEWAMHWHRKGMIEKIIDPHIASNINGESLKKFLEAAEKCLTEYGVDRPSMGDVLWNLEYSLQLQEAASMQVEDKSECMIIGMEKQSNGIDSKEGLDFEIADDSSVTVEGSSLFSQMGHFQGR